MTTEKMREPGTLEAHAQPFLRIIGLTTTTTNAMGQEQIPQPVPTPFPSSVTVAIPAGGSVKLTVKASYRMAGGMKVIGILTDQNSATQVDIGPVDGATCGSDMCVDLVMNTSGKNYWLDIQIVDTSTPTKVLVSVSGPDIGT